MGLQKPSPLAMTFTAEDHQQLSNSPRTPRLQKSLSRASPDWHPFFLGCHMNTSGLWLSPELFCSGGPSYNSDIPQKTGHLKRWSYLWLLAVVLNPLAKCTWMCISICTHIVVVKKKDNNVINTVTAWHIELQVRYSWDILKTLKYWQHTVYKTTVGRCLT